MNKKIKIFFTLFSLFFFALSFLHASEESNQIGNAGLKLISEGRVDEGFDLLRQAIQLDPEEPAWHMNYGSMLFQVGQSIFKSGEKEKSKELFKESEKELLEATKLFKKAEDPVKAQCFYLIGDIYYYAYQNISKAKYYYEEALARSPKHPGALDGLKNCQASLGLDKNSKIAQEVSGPSTKKPADSPQNISFKNKIYLKNGLAMECEIIEKTPKGYWVQIGEGTKTFFDNSEITKVTDQAN